MDNPNCKHENFVTGAMVGRHTATEGGPVRAFTASFTLHCDDCHERFHFAPYARFKDSRFEVEMGCAPGPAPLEAPWVPGAFECPKCQFRLAVNTLDASTGAVSLNREAKPEECPNDGETMKRVTWQQQARDNGEAAIKYVRRLRQLEEAWPEGYEMPAEQDDDQ